MKRRGGTGRGRTKEARAIVKAVEAGGGTVERTGQGHLKITGPNGGVAVVSSDPGSNAMQTTLRTIEQRAGMKLEL